MVLSTFLTQTSKRSLWMLSPKVDVLASTTKLPEQNGSKNIVNYMWDRLITCCVLDLQRGSGLIVLYCITLSWVCFSLFLAFVSLNTKANDWQLSRVYQKRDSQRNSGCFKVKTFTACCKMIHGVPLNELLWSSLGNLICPWSSKATGKSSGKGWRTPLCSSFAMKDIPHTSFLTDVPLTDVPFLVLQTEDGIGVSIS